MENLGEAQPEGAGLLSKMNVTEAVSTGITWHLLK